MRVSINPAMCCAAGQCVLIAPDVFDQADDGTVVVLLSEPPADREGAVREAEAVCPGMAIQVEG
ncbi:ferredoxin [Streptomyces sp. AP-93]|uniref:ferredoxin n=1 Tax=Streptomyces sp. AP-93 TaxID=2929048 RepID=UPI001FAECFAA|nr:ferredoxin [Streptomyces sp. AP-93]MCJ0873080.1 ferredoxin [Streptomyces sp. AP-93]